MPLIRRAGSHPKGPLSRDVTGGPGEDRDGKRRRLRGAGGIPFHFRETAANVLTIDEIDPYGKITEFKVLRRADRSPQRRLVSGDASRR